MMRPMSFTLLFGCCSLASLFRMAFKEGSKRDDISAGLQPKHLSVVACWCRGSLPWHTWCQKHHHSTCLQHFHFARKFSQRELPEIWAAKGTGKMAQIHCLFMHIIVKSANQEVETHKYLFLTWAMNVTRRMGNLATRTWYVHMLSDYVTSKGTPLQRFCNWWYSSICSCIYVGA